MMRASVLLRHSRTAFTVRMELMFGLRVSSTLTASLLSLLLSDPIADLVI